MTSRNNVEEIPLSFQYICALLFLGLSGSAQIQERNL